MEETGGRCFYYAASRTARVLCTEVANRAACGTLPATFFRRPRLSTPATILYCRCAYAQVVPSGVKNDVLQKLCDSSASFETVSDLCEMAAHRDPRLSAIAACGRLRIAACYPRAVKGLFEQAGSPLPADAEILNMRTQTAQEIADALLKAEA